MKRLQSKGDIRRRSKPKSAFVRNYEIAKLSHRQNQSNDNHAKVVCLLSCPGGFLTSRELTPWDVSIIIKRSNSSSLGSGRFRRCAEPTGLRRIRSRNKKLPSRWRDS